MTALGPEISTAPVVVIGGGIAGLTATRELLRNGLDVVLYEAGPAVGGMADSHLDESGFTFDTGAHFITNRLATATGIYRQCRDIERYGETVWLEGRSYDYPSGLLRVPRFVRSAIAERTKRHRAAPGSAADQFRRDYGTALADEIALPLIEAWSGTPADDLAPAVAEKLPSSVLETVGLELAGRLTRRAVAVGYCREAPRSASVWHMYPERGIATVCDALAAEVADSIRLNSPVERITVSEHRAVGVRVAGRQVPAAAVVSTAPINVLPRLVEGTDALDRFRAFRFRSMLFPNLMLRGRDLLPHTMTWTPEADFPFFRLTETPQAMPWVAPEGQTLITADVGAAIGDEWWEMDEEEIGERCVEALTEIVPSARRDFLGCRVVRQPNAYPVFLRDYEDDRRSLADGTGIDRLLSIGRNGEFAHILMEDVYWRTLRQVRGLATELKSAGPLAA